MLRKALDKFPPGTGKRWEVVQGYERTRTVEVILDIVKHGLKAGESMGDARVAWREVAEGVLAANARLAPAGPWVWRVWREAS